MFRAQQKQYIPAEWICNFISLAPCVVLQMAASGAFTMVALDIWHHKGSPVASLNDRDEWISNIIFKEV